MGWWWGCSTSSAFLNFWGYCSVTSHCISIIKLPRPRRRLHIRRARRDKMPEYVLPILPFPISHLSHDLYMTCQHCFYTRIKDFAAHTLSLTWPIHWPKLTPCSARSSTSSVRAHSRRLGSPSSRMTYNGGTVMLPTPFAL